MSIEARQKALLHIYPDLSGLDGARRRDLLFHATGCNSAADPSLTQEGFERAMADYEAVLWDRVDQRLARDPRNCPSCGRPLTRTSHPSWAECPEGCGRFRVYAWSRTYWRDKLPSAHLANSRQLYRLRDLWAHLCRELDAEHATDRYLAGIVARGGRGDVQARERTLIGVGSFRWDAITSAEAHRTIEALKDRLAHVHEEVPF